jgi:hypothetical protein
MTRSTKQVRLSELLVTTAICSGATATPEVAATPSRIATTASADSGRTAYVPASRRLTSAGPEGGGTDGDGAEDVDGEGGEVGEVGEADVEGAERSLGGAW